MRRMIFFFLVVKESAVTLDHYSAVFLKFGSPVLTSCLLFGKSITFINLSFFLCTITYY